MAAAAGRGGGLPPRPRQAAREISHGPSGEDLPYLALNETHLARWRGNCLVHFGDPSTITDLTAALAAMDDSFTRAEAGLRCDLAAALHVTRRTRRSPPPPRPSQRNSPSSPAQPASAAASADLARRIGQAA